MPGSSGKILSITGEDFARTARVSFDGVVKEVSLAYIPEANVGDYAVVHVGFAIELVERGRSAAHARLPEADGRVV